MYICFAGDICVSTELHGSVSIFCFYYRSFLSISYRAVMVVVSCFVFFLFLFHIFGCFACIFLCAMYVSSPRTGVTDCCQPSGARNQTQVLMFAACLKKKNLLLHIWSKTLVYIYFSGIFLFLFLVWGFCCVASNASEEMDLLVKAKVSRKKKRRNFILP